MKKRILLTIVLTALLTCLLAVGVGANTETESELSIIDNGNCGYSVTWTLYSDGELVIDGTGAITSSPWRSSYSSNIKTVTIEDSVTSIGEYAFYNCDSLTSVTIPDSITSIGESAFYNCKNLASVDIPDSVTSIGDYAFHNCDSLTSVYIGDSVTSIGDYAFYNCNSLTNVNISSIGSWCAIQFGDYVSNPISFAHNLCLNGILIEDLEIPDSVTSIGDYAFYNCESLTSVTIPDSVTSIGDYAFYNCDSLTSVDIPDSVTSIGSGVFSNCNSLTSINVDSNNTNYSSDEYGVLFDKNKTALIQYPVDNPRTEYVISDSVTTIGEKAFSSSPHLKSVTIGNSVINIGYQAFFAAHLTNVTIPDSVESIGNNAFYLSRLKSVTIGNSVTSIGHGAFMSTNLTSVTIPDSVTSIGYGAFYGCTSLTSVDIGDSVTSIGYDAFYGTVYYNDSSNWENGVLYMGNYLIEADNITGNYSVKEGTLVIGDDAFCSCKSLTSVDIPDSVTSIGKQAFEYCDSLTSVDIGDSVTNIGERAFSSCKNLTSVTIPNSVTTIGNGVFASCTSLTSVTIPDSVTTISDSVFASCKSLTSVDIPDSVESIGNNAFVYCTSLAKATIYSRNATFGSNVFRSSSASFEIHGYAGSTAEAYANKNKHKFVALEEFTPIVSFVTASDNSALAPDTQILAITAEENNTTYSMGDVNFYWSSRYNAYLAIVGDDVTEDDVLSGLTATEGADPDVIAYDGDVNGDGKVTAGDAALVARLLKSPDIDGCTDLMRFEADTYASAEETGYSVTLDDAMYILYAAVGLKYNG